jgi:hypothetical protein
MKLIWFRHMVILAPLAANLFSFYIHLVTSLNPRTQGTNPCLEIHHMILYTSLKKRQTFSIQQLRSTFEMLKSMASQS